ncbi:hypothetical protein [Pantoea coffeiphila]|uniref:hypothetical protein n=1 Tax=Pantoea coffeiphila TaxID=1465635 RepID=UPI0019609687|nr:hypothetical protein [Pantoea coffeiphila]MBM7343817.1 hypothetical protein [Pantoea coffeiphila]
MRINIEKCILPVFFIFISVKAFYGPLGLVSPMVNYVGAALMFLFLVIRWARSFIARREVLLVTLLLTIYILVGIVKNGLFQSIFGVYVLIPFLFSLAYSDVLSEKVFLKSNKYFLFLGVTCYLGVLYVSFFGAPWVGAKLNVGGYEKVLSRDWTTGGILRNPGFTIASFDAATLLMICSFFISYSLLEKKKFVFSFLTLLVFIYPIYLTTTKTTLVTYFLLIILFLSPSFLTVAVSRLFLIGMVIFTYVYMIPSATYTKFDSTNSFEIRMFQTWPDAIKLLQDNLSIVFGNGFGSIGMPSMFSLGKYNPADNMLVYFFVISGMISVLFVGVILFKFATISFALPKFKKKYYLFSFCIFSGGLSYNLFESVFYAPFAGILIGMLFNKNISRADNSTIDDFEN